MHFMEDEMARARARKARENGPRSLRAVLEELAERVSALPEASRERIRGPLEEALSLVRGPTHIKDARIERALAVMRERLAEDLDLAALARIAGLSRAAFARRFVEAVGEPPQRHRTRQRIAEASRLLTETDATLMEIALAVGYANEFALGRAFKRELGVPPGVFRKQRAGHTAPVLRLAA
jgi:transcriptional regulator GlxA family with amidase domain